MYFLLARFSCDKLLAWIWESVHTMINRTHMVQELQVSTGQDTHDSGILQGVAHGVLASILRGLWVVGLAVVEIADFWECL